MTDHPATLNPPASDVVALEPSTLAFIVGFINACRRAETDASIQSLIEALRAVIDFSSAWTGACSADRGAGAWGSEGPPRGALDGCVPQRHPEPEATGGNTRACLATGQNASTCLVLEDVASAHAREILRHVAPHLLEAVRRVTRAREALASDLTPREMEILHWLVEGKSNEVIARILGVAPRTVKFHLANLYAKLGVTTRAQAAAAGVGRLFG